MLHNSHSVYYVIRYNGENVPRLHQKIVNLLAEEGFYLEHVSTSSEGSIQNTFMTCYHLRKETCLHSHSAAVYLEYKVTKLIEDLYKEHFNDVLDIAAPEIIPVSVKVIPKASASFRVTLVIPYVDQKGITSEITSLLNDYFTINDMFISPVLPSKLDAPLADRNSEIKYMYVNVIDRLPAGHYPEDISMPGDPLKEKLEGIRQAMQTAERQLIGRRKTDPNATLSEEERNAMKRVAEEVRCALYSKFVALQYPHPSREDGSELSEALKIRVSILSVEYSFPKRPIAEDAVPVERVVSGYNYDWTFESAQAECLEPEPSASVEPKRTGRR